LARALRPGGRLALTAFSAYFAVRHVEENEHFDADAGVNHERTSVRDDGGRELEATLSTACYTPRELRLLLRAHGFTVRSIASSSPGAYGDAKPGLDAPEYLVIAEKAGWYAAT
jgi:hypothetical protein